MSFRFPARWLGCFMAFLLAMALTGCNKLKLGYEYADWLVTYSVEDNFDLDRPQRNQLKDEVDAYFHWHRKQMLPLYAEFAAYVADSARNGLRPLEIDSGFARYRALYRTTMEPVVERSMPLLQSLSPEQVDQWLERQHKKNAKLRKEFSGSLEERLEHRYQKIVDEMEDWTGKLSKEQKAKIKVLNRTLPWNGNLWLETREKMQDHLADLLKKRAPKEELKGFLGNYLLDTDLLKSPDYRLKSREFEARMRTLIYIIHNSLTSEQKRRFIQQVEKLSNDFRVLSSQG
ncbi:MAG: hypothetical protein JWP91_3799 [Fibrobacteres bacterium]|nr:hypothetical protein [Fibrobacterota bacterium]